jgi:protocatechuate 3,4-dioxygenase beta subunit
MNARQSNRRRFIGQASAVGAMLPWVGQTFAEDLAQTPAQTAGPFYPVPEIAKQLHSDADLTRRANDGPLAEGERIEVRGRVVGIDGRPLSGAVVELWQACYSGRYQHQADSNQAPLDPNFQYCARLVCDSEGTYRFQSIIPGKYPGRTPHIHFRVLAEGFPELVTQMYFQQFGEANQKDGVYSRLSMQQKESVTVPFAKQEGSERLQGDFRMVLAHAATDRATPPMP